MTAHRGLRTTMNKEIFIGLMVAMFLGAGLLVVEVGVGIPSLQQKAYACYYSWDTSLDCYYNPDHPK